MRLPSVAGTPITPSINRRNSSARSLMRLRPSWLHHRGSWHSPRHEALRLAHSCGYDLRGSITAGVGTAPATKLCAWPTHAATTFVAPSRELAQPPPRSSAPGPLTRSTFAHERCSESGSECSIFTGSRGCGTPARTASSCAATAAPKSTATDDSSAHSNNATIPASGPYVSPNDVADAEEQAEEHGDDRPQQHRDRRAEREPRPSRAVADAATT